MKDTTKTPQCNIKRFLQVAKIENFKREKLILYIF